MPPFVPRPRAVVAIDRKLAQVQRDRAVARSQLAGALADLAQLEHDEDVLLELRTAEVENRRSP